MNRAQVIQRSVRGPFILFSLLLLIIGVGLAPAASAEENQEQPTEVSGEEPVDSFELPTPLGSQEPAVEPEGTNVSGDGFQLLTPLGTAGNALQIDFPKIVIQLKQPLVEATLVEATLVEATLVEATSVEAIPGDLPAEPAQAFQLRPITREQNAWTGVRMCESSGDYGAINPQDTDGTPSYGGYQFKQRTWDWVVEYGQRPDLVGVRPDHALPSQQDWAAEQLRIMPGGGLGHWPYCGQFYGS